MATIEGIKVNDPTRPAFRKANDNFAALKTETEAATAAIAVNTAAIAELHALADGLSAVEASTSGTSVDFTSIRADARRITINFMGVSTDGSETLLLRIGDSAGLKVANYVSSASEMGEDDTISNADATTGFALVSSAGPSVVLYGHVVLTLAVAATNTWVVSGTLVSGATGDAYVCAGAASLSGVLDRLSLLTAPNGDDFDAGAVSIVVE